MENALVSNDSEVNQDSLDLAFSGQNRLPPKLDE